MNSKITLYALPFAGGSKYSYNTFKHKFPDFIDFQAIEIPGRGERMTENLIGNIDELVDDVFCQIRDHLQSPYAFYGHSMGTVLAYLVTKKIIAEELPQPIHLVMTGSGGPSNEDRERDRHTLSKEAFKAKLKEYGGSPSEILENDELFNFFEPIIKNDFKVVETYEYEATEPFDIPMTVAIGLSEDVTLEEAKLWEKETTQKVSVRQMPGGHFFIYENTDNLVNIISRSVYQSV